MLLEEILTEGGNYNKLQKFKVQLTADERDKVIKAKAVWNHGPNGEETPAVWKSQCPKTGKCTFVTQSHRAYNTAPSLKGAIGKYHSFIKGTS